MPKQLSLLLIEDDHLLGPLYFLLLKEAQYDVSLVESGQEAREKMKQRSFNLILMDVMLPEMSGVELIDFLRPAKTPIVALTNLDQTKVKEELKKKGAIGVIIKSDHTPDSFLTVVSEYLTMVA